MAVDEADRTDPDVRAGARVRAFEQRQRRTRTTAGVLLGGAAAVSPFLAAPLTGEPGATVGAVVGALLLAGCAGAVWPWAWSSDERRHHELTAIWAQARGDTDTSVPWDRYAAWAGADGRHVELVLLRLAGTTDDPSPLSTEVVRRLDPDDVAGAASAMEQMRGELASEEAAERRAQAAAVARALRRR